MWQSHVEIMPTHLLIASPCSKHHITELGQGSHTLCNLLRYPHIYEAQVTPTLNGSLEVQRFEHSDTRQNNIRFLRGTVTNYTMPKKKVHRWFTHAKDCWTHCMPLWWNFWWKNITSSILTFCCGLLLVLQLTHDKCLLIQGWRSEVNGPLAPYWHTTNVFAWGE